MSLKLYNTFKREKEELQPIEEGKVRIYSCGQTIYDDLHIGNANTYAYWDILTRYLDWKGFDVFHVQNITDVGHLTDDRDQGEDKVEKKGEGEGHRTDGSCSESVRALLPRYGRLEHQTA